MENVIFWDVTPCGYCKNRYFRGMYRLHHQGEKNQWASEILVLTTATHHISKQTAFFTVTAVRTSNLTQAITWVYYIQLLKSVLISVKLLECRKSRNWSHQFHVPLVWTIHRCTLQSSTWYWAIPSTRSHLQQSRPIIWHKKSIISHPGSEGAFSQTLQVSHPQHVQSASTLHFM
jgi:hypothetical protein